MNRIEQLFQDKKDILSIYFTSGYPKLEDTRTVLKGLQGAGVDLVEIGLPFSDPLADGPTIQQSSEVALDNGMSTIKLFEQLSNIREEVSMPLIIMGYINPVIQYGIEAFCAKCNEVGIDGLILPDLPVHEYEAKYKAVFERYGLFNIFLITPQTSEDRIREIDEKGSGFIYMVSTASTTGAQNSFSEDSQAYFKRIADMNLRLPRLTGFGISNKQTFSQACENSSGAIIGSAFIKHLATNGVGREQAFVDPIKS